LKGYIIFFALIASNLAWLANPHACCPRMENCVCSEMLCMLSQPSVDCSSSMLPKCADMQNNDYIRLTLSDQFSKGVNNFPAESISAAMLVSYDQNLTLQQFQNSVFKIQLPGSFVGPPVEKPPAVN
jgi:hypothetical protein